MGRTVARIRFLLAAVVAAGVVTAALLAQSAADAPPERPPVELAVLGDSLGTGAAAHPGLVYDARALWDAFTGAIDLTPDARHLPADLAALVPAGATMTPPLRLWPSRREFRGGPDWLWRVLLHSLSTAYLDTEEYSWGYLTALQLGTDPARLAVAAENGSRMEAMPRQLDRLLDALGGELPRRLLVLYTGNDLCGATMGQTTSAEAYGAALKRGLLYAARNGRPARDGGTDLHVVSFLSIVQLLHDEAILAKEVRAHGAVTTCRELRAAHYGPRQGAPAPPALPPEGEWFGLVMPPNPGAFCPTLFGTGDGREDVVRALANRVRDYRQQEAQVISEWRERPAAGDSGLRVHHLADTAGLIFSPDDIADDCFHLSAAGQAKVARAVAGALRRQ